MKKICFITTVSATLRAFIVEFAKYLHEHCDLEITFICDNDEAFVASLPSYIKFIPVSMKRGISPAGFGAIFRFVSIFKREKFDMIQYSTPNASFYASIAARFSGVPIRLYCQWGLLYVGFQGWKRMLLKTLEKIVCINSTWIEPISHRNLAFAREEKLIKEKNSSVVWNGSASGIDFRKFDISNKQFWRSEIRAQLGISKSTFVFGFVGRISRDKGSNELLKAFREMIATHPDCVLLFVGDFDGNISVESELLEWSQSEKRVIYNGFSENVEKYLAAMDVFVFPSYREGFGESVIEAESMAVPVIVTDIPGPIDGVLPGETGITVPKQDSKSLLEAMKSLYEDREFLVLLSNRGAEHVKKNYDRKVLFKMFMDDRIKLIESVSKKKGAKNA